MTAVAFIPARSGSVRIPDKNIKPLGGKPLMAWAIEAALESGVFSGVYMSSDDEFYLGTGVAWGANPIRRPAEYATTTSPDYQWFRHALMDTWEDTRADMVAILRCTSPFLKAETIARAVNLLQSDKKADSVRAVRRVREHPGKMWIAHGFRMLPLMPYRLNDTPWHSNQTGELPEVYVQTAGLEVVRTEAVWQTSTISGDAVIPFILEGEEALDINTPEDWGMAETIVKARER